MQHVKTIGLRAAASQRIPEGGRAGIIREQPRRSRLHDSLEVLNLMGIPLSCPLEKRTQIWPERIAYRQGKQGRNEHERDAHHVPEPSPGHERLIAVVRASAMIPVSIP
jgi:hypothetical protein